MNETRQNIPKSLRILIICTIDAKYDNREETLCEHLNEEFMKRGHETDVCYLPFKRDMVSAPEQIYAYSLVNTTHCDALVTIGYPACFVPFNTGKKVCYLFDCYPEIHEDFIFELREFRVDERVKIVEGITRAEGSALGKAAVVFTSSIGLQETLNNRYGIRGQVMATGDMDLPDRIEDALL